MPTNNALFVDTSGWAAVFDRDDPDHIATAAIVAESIRQHRTLVTTNYVLAEIVALFSSRRMHTPHTEMVTAMTLIKTEPGIRIEHIDLITDEEAWQLVVSRPDKRWSLVDASSFVVMRRLGITDALTADHHFEQAGFTRMLGSHP
jgi:predicted nucleic acid-binding protein